MKPTITDPPRHVFVYGTLRRGELNDINQLKPAPVFVGNAKINGDLYHLGNYPGVRLGGENEVFGEVYQITPALEHRLDEIESIRPTPTGEYTRQQLPVQCLEKTLTCLVYEIAATRILGKTQILSGDWVQREVTE